MAMIDREPATARDDLVRAARGGDTDAFAALVRAEYRTLVMAARAILGDHHEAEDAAHDALVAAWRDLASLRQPSSFGPWLSRILTRTALRRRKRRPRLVPLADVGPVAAPAPAEDERRDRLLLEVRRLPERYRVLLSLHYLRGHSLAEIAGITGLPEKRVKSRLFEARTKLKGRLGHEERR